MKAWQKTIIGTVVVVHTLAVALMYIELRLTQERLEQLVAKSDESSIWMRLAVEELTFYDILDNALKDPKVRDCLDGKWSGFTNDLDEMYEVVPGLARAKHSELGKPLSYLLECSIETRG